MLKSALRHALPVGPRYQHLEPPPRNLPLTLLLRVLLGGWSGQFGWAFFAFGSIFGWAFIGQSELKSLWQLSGALSAVEGQVTQIRGTGSSENDESILAVEFSYEYQGQTYEGTSYLPESEVSFTPGSKLTVEFNPDRPRIARALGMRSAPFGYFVLIVLIFPGVGLIFLVLGLRAGLASLHLLRSGVATRGRLVQKRPTNVTINDRPVMELIFEFRDNRGMTQRASAKSHNPAALEDEPEEFLLYDPQEPSRAVLWDNLPGTARVGADGRLLHSSIFGVAKVLILPGLALFINSIGWLLS